MQELRGENAIPSPHSPVIYRGLHNVLHETPSNISFRGVSLMGKQNNGNKPTLPYMLQYTPMAAFT